MKNNETLEMWVRLLFVIFSTSVVYTNVYDVPFWASALTNLYIALTITLLVLGGGILVLASHLHVLSGKKEHEKVVDFFKTIVAGYDNKLIDVYNQVYKYTTVLVLASAGWWFTLIVYLVAVLFNKLAIYKATEFFESKGE